MAEPLVSIIVPAYNAAPWLAETLESALAQTWRVKEIIVVDDGSADDTLKVAREYESRGVSVMSQVNRGACAARNLGLQKARGHYIQYLDADDVISPDKIAHQVAMLETLHEGVVATSRWGRFRHDIARSRFGLSPYWCDLEPRAYLAQVAKTGNSIPIHAWLLPKGLVDAAGPFSEELGLMDDHEYFARLVLKSAGLRFCAVGCSYYRTFHVESLSRRRDAAAQSMFRAVELIESHLLAAGTSPDLRQIAADYYQWLVYSLYPDAPDLICLAEQRVEALGGSAVRPRMGRRAHALARIVGWKTVQRLRMWLWRKGVYLGKNDLISD